MSLHAHLWLLQFILLNLSVGCLNHTDAFLIGRTVLKFPVDLDQKKERKTSVSLKDYKCSLYGYYFDYNGFQIRWKNVTSGIFKLKQKGREKIVSIEVRLLNNLLLLQLSPISGFSFIILLKLDGYLLSFFYQFDESFFPLLFSFFFHESIWWQNKPCAQQKIQHWQV